MPHRQLAISRRRFIKAASASSLALAGIAFRRTYAGD
jgi:hypothetical protein